MNLPPLDLGQFAFAATVVIGFVNGISLAIDQDWKGFALFVTALIAATVFGILHWFGLPSAEVGFAIGISSSGVYKVAKKIGGA